MIDLPDFLLARIAEDEAAAREAAVMPYGEEIGWIGHVFSSERDSTPAQDEHITRWDPDRVLAECDAKRQVVDVYRALAVRRHDVGSIRWHEVSAYETVLRQLALPYADHPDYRSEWRP